MGCIASKQAVSVTPAFDYSGSTYSGSGMSVKSRRGRRKKLEELEKRSIKGGEESELGESGRGSSSNADSISMRLGNLHKYIEGEQVAAGWPAWLTAVAGEAIQGWVPLKADSFEKLEKVIEFYPSHPFSFYQVIFHLFVSFGGGLNMLKAVLESEFFC